MCPCEYDFKPVCGSDGITYPNKNILECYSSNYAKMGKSPVTLCDDGVTCNECVCLPINLPVCSCDGKTYTNECELSCENYRRTKQNKPLVYLAYRAACLGPSCGCSTVASPVCGTDNVLYRNRCELNCASNNAKAKGLSVTIEFKNVGACLDGCQCPATRDPVCGTDGLEYNNLCEISCANRRQTCSLSAPVRPASKNTCKKPCICPTLYDPVCASDGKMEPRTFSNVCEVNCEAERTNNPELYVIGFGACPTCFCTGEYLPVCGTDCKTYTNECELRCANACRPKGATPISVVHSGPCLVDNCDCSYCDMEYKPVCGTNKVTYMNMCWLNCDCECSQRQNGPEISLAWKGSCSS